MTVSSGGWRAGSLATRTRRDRLRRRGTRSRVCGDLSHDEQPNTYVAVWKAPKGGQNQVHSTGSNERGRCLPGGGVVSSRWSWCASPMSFFTDDEDPGDHVAEEPERDPRHGPAEDELPAVVSLGMRWAVSTHAVVVLESARVFSDGVLFEVSRYLRRGDLTVREFQQLTHEERYGSSDDRGRRLRVGAVLPDGEEINDSHRPGAERGATRSVLVRRGGSGGGGAWRYRHSDELWLHPLPSEGQLTLVLQWLALDIAETRLTVSATDLVRAADEATSLWDD